MLFPSNTDRTSSQPCKYGHNSGRDSTRHCLECKRLREKERYQADPKAILLRRTLRPIPPSQTREGRNSWTQRNPERCMLHSARVNAKRGDFPCSIALTDIVIPEFCPLLGIRIERSTTGRRNDASPSLDKIKPELGYVRGNVWVISWRANRIKNNATLQELQMITERLASVLS